MKNAQDFDIHRLESLWWLLNIPKVNRYKCTIQITKFKDNDADASTSLKVNYVFKI